MSAQPKTLFGFDPATLLFVSALLLVSMGCIMVTSASLGVSESLTNGATAFYFVKRHLIYLGLGVLMGVFVYQIPIARWQQFGWLLLLLALALLLVVLTPLGKTVNGSQRWINLGLFSIQASEIAKICVVAYLAGYLVRRQEEVRSKWSGFFKPIFVLCLVVMLLLMEPDFGAVVVLMAAALGMIFLSGVRLQQFLVIGAVSLVAAVLLVYLEPYRWQRFLAFTDPWAHKWGSGYQLTQSLIAFGRGEWFGVGLGNSVQKLFYLPEAHTDFVFAVLAEELGLLGNLFIVAAFVLLVTCALTIGRQAEEQDNFFAGYFCYGLGLLISVQAMINIGVNVGALPTKGLTLPLVSYGGSSLIVSCMMIGIIMRVAQESKQHAMKPAKAKSKAKSRQRKPMKTAEA